MRHASYPSNRAPAVASCRDTQFEPAACESLEARVLLANTPIGIVQIGRDYRSSVEDFTTTIDAIDGWVTDDNVLVTMESGLEVRTPLILRDDGTFNHASPFWREHVRLDREYGTQFLPRDGFVSGWWSGGIDSTTGVDPLSQTRLIVALAAPETSVATLDGTWRVITYDVKATGFQEGSTNGLLSIDTSAGTIAWNVEFGERPHVLSTVSDWSSANTFITAQSERFYLSADGQTLIFADLDTRDGWARMGYATRVDESPVADDIAGSYYLKQHPDGFQMRLELNADGTFEGNPFPIVPRFTMFGTWHVEGDELVVNRTADFPQTYRFAVAADGGTLVSISYDPWLDDEGSVSLFGLATRKVAPGSRHDPVSIIPSLDENGTPILFIDRTNQPWQVVDVVAESGGPAIEGELVAWFDPATGTARAAGTSAEGIVLFEESESGAWTATVLADLLGSSLHVTSPLALAIADNGQVNLFGTTADGELLRYFTRPVGSGPEQEWVLHNITVQELQPRGRPTPVFQGKLAAYITPWGGINLAGTSPPGRIWIVWWAPRSDGWFTSRINTLDSNDRLIGGVSAMVSPEHGIVLSGVNPLREVVIQSWRPGDGGTWNQFAFTDSSRPRLVAGSVSSVYSPLDRSLSIFGRTPDDEVIMYWWDPTRIGEGWAHMEVGGLSTGVYATTTEDGEISVSGLDRFIADTRRIYTRWRNAERVVAPPYEFWESENLTEIAE